MSNCLYLRFTNSDSQQLSWLPTDSNGPTEEPTLGSPEEAAEIAGSRRIILLAPAADVLLIQPSLPTQNRQRLLQAIPFALENQIASDIDQQHFTVGPQNKDNSLPVAIISKLKIEHWLNTLEAAGIRPHAIYPETLCLPYSEGDWTLLADKNRTLLRCGKFSGLTLDFENSQQMIALLLERAEESPPNKINLITCGEESQAQFNDSRLAEFTKELVVSSCDEEPLLLMAKNCNPSENLNLLHGPYQQDNRGQLIWRSWYPALTIALILTTLSIASALHELSRLDQQHQALSQQIEQLFKKSLPESRKMVNPRAQMSQKLQALQGNGSGNSSFLTLVNLTGKAINNQPKSTIDGLSYRQGELSIQLTIKDLQLLELLKKELEKSQLSVNIRSANVQKDSVKAHLQIGEMQ
ncbi:MAG: type II secretion system protein GspL [Candidatus Polarisedimenticolaceae bacterium]|nr:type II secretion system protein GspL [Candidatus Polarisedimenticolaceae bacterium]